MSEVVLIEPGLVGACAPPKQLLTTRVYRWAATNTEPYAHGIQGVAQMLSLAAARKHEPGDSYHAAWQRIPAIEVECALAQQLGRDAAGE
jgi:hypothetical protein